MKKLVSFVTVLAVITLLGIGVCHAATQKIIDVSASVPNTSPEMSVTILKFTDGNPDNNPWTNSSQVTSMSFGTLRHIFDDGSEADLWFGNPGFCVVMFAQAFGNAYDLRSSCAGVTSGGNRFPDNSFGLTPVYSQYDKWVWATGEKEQGVMPATATLGSAGSAVATNKLIYTSETAGSARILQAYYGLPPYKLDGSDPFPGFEPIPLDQPPGDYNGQVTISIVLQ